MSERPIQIMSVNVHRRNVIQHGLLHSSSYDILLIQEPWFGRINVTRTDNDPDGVEIQGTVANNMWECFLPPHSPTDTCKVAIYIRSSLSWRAFV